ncbi:YqzE family protein [Bacillus sp. FJAT-42315]|uniref:YqzE family protein n=1 Tax=Bacillus sp. FJAT-42315 TaxID=2014077 RepID=UPI000BA99F44|nr:YqzE family protein [Bacillus sp. FJAT-42315]PAQ14819.1 YqzE family protein [Bacillaceae bacterium SAOS 7]
MSIYEVIRYCTQSTLSYLNEPKQERKQKRQRRKTERPAFSSRWFGVLPWAVRQLFRKSS